MREQPNTPGLGGYVLAVVVSVLTVSTGLVLVVAFALLVMTGVGPGVADAFSWLASWLFVTAVGLLFAAPLAALAVPVIHVLCRDEPLQRVHVLVTGVVTFVLVLVVLLVPADGEVVLLGTAPAVVAASTMIGRASVVPLVERRRARTAASNDPIRR